MQLWSQTWQINNRAMRYRQLRGAEKGRSWMGTAHHDPESPKHLPSFRLVTATAHLTDQFCHLDRDQWSCDCRGYGPDNAQGHPELLANFPSSQLAAGFVSRGGEGRSRVLGVRHLTSDNAIAGAPFRARTDQGSSGSENTQRAPTIWVEISFFDGLDALC